MKPRVRDGISAIQDAFTRNIRLGSLIGHREGAHWSKMFAASGNLPDRPPYIGNIRPTGAYSTVSKPSEADRLSDQIKANREKAGRLPAGPERDELLRKVEQDEVALRLIQWVTSSGHLPPPSGLIPVKRHPLGRK
jgi:hypothetical protein